MRFRLPPDCAGVSHAGVSIDISSDTTIEVDPDAASLLAPHGIVPVIDPPPIDPARITGMARAELIDALEARYVAIPAKSSDTALRGLLRDALARSPR